MGILSKISVNRVLLLLVLLIFATAALPFISYAPNHLVSDEGRQLWDVRSDMAWGLAVACLLLFLLCLVPGKPGNILTLVINQLLVIAALVAAGTTATYLAKTGSPLARTGLGSGFWLGLGLMLLAAGNAVRRTIEQASWRQLLHAQMFISPLVPLFSGTSDDLSLSREYANRQDAFNDALAQHLTIPFTIVVPALATGVLLDIWCAFSASHQGLVFMMLNIIQTTPSAALSGLLITPLAGLVKHFPSLGSLGVAGIGLTFALIALVLYALLPLVCGVVAGLYQVSHDVLGNTRAMGMSVQQWFSSVQFLLASSVFLHNLRVAMVQMMGMAIIATLIGAGGLDALVSQGLLSSAADLVLLGVIPAMALAMLVDAPPGLGLALLKVTNND